MLGQRQLRLLSALAVTQAASVYQLYLHQQHYATGCMSCLPKAPAAHATVAQDCNAQQTISLSDSVSQPVLTSQRHYLPSTNVSVFVLHLCLQPLCLMSGETLCQAQLASAAPTT